MADIPVRKPSLMYSDSGPQLHSSLTDVELRQVIDRLSRKIDYLYRAMGVPYPDDDLPGYVMQARELILLDRDAEAIKVVREHTAVGIVEARAIVEDMRRRLMRPTAAPASNAAGPTSSPRPTALLSNRQAGLGASLPRTASGSERQENWSPASAPSPAPATAGVEAGVEQEVPRLSADEIWADDSSALVG